ncbi:putative fimbrial usher protein [Advenella kashmirensis WT001]|uniref:Putative fimbrial usher protein n=1 Tax=Advenella kashmirensis (strain DSM 17095 / LMG 22695 / WT001) TaxID=1036672 RepID=I3UAF1_ADVKW|nr:FimD/PapC N-terminal domain-containing protein [Advenella kashmirensis]AFK61989.1 putative fimbrial usher protein [Advenella kashmirensis WT001]
MRRYLPTPFTYTVLISVLFSFVERPAASQQKVEFDAVFLRGTARHELDISRFTHRNSVPPGEYESDIYVNNIWKGKTRLRFREQTPNGKTALCMNDAVLRILDLDTTRLSYSKIGDADQHCMSAAAAIPQATINYRLDDFRLDVNIAQIYVRQRPRGYISLITGRPGFQPCF